MTPDEKISKVKQLFAEIKKTLFGDTPPANMPPAGENVALPDGTAMMLVPGIQQGATATIAGQPAPDGEYALPDGSTLVIAGGVVASIESATVEDAEGAGSNPALDMQSETINWLKDQVSQLISKFNAVSKENEMLKAAFGKQTEAMEILTDSVTEISKAPVMDVLDKKKNPFAKESPANRLEELTVAIRKLRNEN